MTFAEIKSEIFRLNWEQESNFSEDKGIIFDALNRAMSIILTEVRPLYGQLVIQKAENAPIDLKALDTAFLRLISIENTRFKEISCYEVKRLSWLYFDSGFDDFPVTVYFEKSFVRFDENTADDFVIELGNDIVALLPLLASYFIWLDDEQARSEGYYNQYEMRRDAFLRRENKMSAVIINQYTDGGGFNWI